MSNGRPVQITIRSGERPAALTEQKMEMDSFAYTGAWFEKGGKPFILFEEALEDGTRVNSAIRIDQDKVAVLRHERIGGHMVLDPNHRQKSSYLSPYGPLSFYVTTQELMTRVEEDQIQIRASYSLQMLLTEDEATDATRQDVQRWIEIDIQ